MAAVPETLTNAIATYGEEGACWSLPGVTEADCWTECAALMDAVRVGSPDAMACWECESDGDCGEAASCSESHACVDWECQTDDDCPASTPVCLPSHVCDDGQTGHCQDSKMCFHGPIDRVERFCGETYVPGPCSTEGAIGFCTMTLLDLDITVYAEDSDGEAERFCSSSGGMWMPV